ncbi:MAG: hypothetical protein CMC13_00060 [Flavobacteriaceae bacterium]|nr:hypothetical protein [Flavobacteriaceae bacterium]|tara:strand:+ start:2198 stop:3706 length:1509 start_codon:yes stop_codon:yes gene_type:complete
MINNPLIKKLKKSSFVKKISASTKAKDLLNNSLWSIFGALFSKGLLFITWIVVARVLGSEGYGQFGIVRSTVLMFVSFAGFSLGVTASKHVAEFINFDKQKTERILGLTMTFGLLMGVAVGIIFYILAPWLAINTLNSKEIIPELQIGAIILFFSSLNGAQIGALQGFMAFKTIAKINISQSLISIPLFILGAIYLGVYGTVWAFAISYILICFLSYFAIRRVCKKYNLRINYGKVWEERQILFNYSLPAFLGGLMVTPVKWYTDSLLVSQSGFREMGIFTAVMTFNGILLMSANMVSAPFTSIMARNKDESRDSKFNRFNILAPWVMGIFFTTPLLFFPEVGSYIFGESFDKQTLSITLIFILLFSSILMFKQGLDRLIAVHDLQWLGFFSNLIWAVVLILTFYLNDNKNSISLSYSYFLAYFISTLFIIPICFKKNIIPKNTFESKQGILIWILFGGFPFIHMLIENLFVKLFIMLSSLTIMVILFNYLFKNKPKKSNLG